MHSPGVPSLAMIGEVGPSCIVERCRSEVWLVVGVGGLAWSVEGDGKIGCWC